MTCRELVELVTDYFEGGLAPADRAAFDEHLALCPGCVTYVEQMRIAMRVTRDAEALERRPEVAALLRTFRTWRAARPALD